MKIFYIKEKLLLKMINLSIRLIEGLINNIQKFVFWHSSNLWAFLPLREFPDRKKDYFQYQIYAEFRFYTSLVF